MITSITCAKHEMFYKKKKFALYREDKLICIVYAHKYESTDNMIAFYNSDSFLLCIIQAKIIEELTMIQDTDFNVIMIE